MCDLVVEETLSVCSIYCKPVSDYMLGSFGKEVPLMIFLFHLCIGYLDNGSLSAGGGREEGAKNCIPFVFLLFSCHTEMEAADQTLYLTQSQYTDTGPTSPSADPITPGAWQGSHWSANL